MKIKFQAIATALLALLALTPGAAYPQSTDGRGQVATVVGLFVQQSSGLLADERLVRGASGQRWAEIRRVGAGVKPDTELVRIPAGVNLQPGDRVLLAGRELSASAGAGSPSQVPIEPYLERPQDLVGLRAPVRRPLSVVPGTCVPF
jgi:hypothetical protein